MKVLPAILLRIVVLMVASVALAATTNALSPVGIAWVQPDKSPVERQAAKAGIEVVDLEQTRRIADEGKVVILDARTEAKFIKGHIPGALSMPMGSAAKRFEKLQLLLPPDQPVLVYCGGAGCDDSLAVAEFLREQGLKDVRLFAGGMNVWRGAGLDQEQGR